MDFSFVLSMNKTFSKSYVTPLLELTLDYIVLNYCLLDPTCLNYATNVPCLLVKSIILILFKVKPKFCNFLLDENFFLHKMPKICELEQKQKIITLKKKKDIQSEI